jgi:hypothetical protein
MFDYATDPTLEASYTSCLARGRPSTEPADRALVQKELERAAASGGFWVATLSRLFPGIRLMEDPALDRFEQKLAEQLGRTDGECAAARREVEQYVVKKRTGLIGSAPLSFPLLSQAERGKKSCLDATLGSLGLDAKASEALRTELRRRVFATLVGAPGDGFSIYLAPRSSDRTSKQHGAVMRTGAELALLDASVTVTTVPKMTRLTIQLRPFEQDVVPITWIEFADSDLEVWGTPSLGCVKTSIEAGGEPISTWIDGVRIGDSRVMVSQDPHDFRILAADGSVLAAEQIAANEIRPSGACHDVSFDLTTRDRTLLLPASVNRSCALSGIGNAEVDAVRAR